MYTVKIVLLVRIHVGRQQWAGGPPRLTAPLGGLGGSAARGASRPPQARIRIYTIGIRYVWRRGLPREAESSLLSGRGRRASGGVAAAPVRLPEGGWVGKRSQRLQGAGRLTRSPALPPPRLVTDAVPRFCHVGRPTRGPPLTYLNRQLQRRSNCYEKRVSFFRKNKNLLLKRLWIIFILIKFLI